MMIDLSNYDLSIDKVDDFCLKIKEESSNDVNFLWLGTQRYEPIFLLQKKIHKDRINNRIKDVILMLEHEHVYTLGKNANSNHILTSQANVVHVDRGGDVTYHGPGQLVCYPIVDLNNYNKSITWYVNVLQESILSALLHYEIDAKKKEFPLYWSMGKR